jgi:hydroxymethylpyrimidine/phosphomethylpyrimidine kinase
LRFLVSCVTNRSIHEPSSVSAFMTSAVNPAVNVALTIAGHDPSSGAGITADLQTFQAHGLFGTSAITALTTQSTLGVAAIAPVEPALLRRTLDYLCVDIPPAGIKIGMLGSAEIASVVAAFVASLHRQGTPIVLDPILRASSGAALLPETALDVLHAELLPAVSWITPNWFELAALAKVPPIGSLAEAEAAVHRLAERHPHLNIVATGGDHAEPVDLLRTASGEVHSFRGEHIASDATHGTGCAFSSALLARLVEGYSLVSAVSAAKFYVAEAIRRAPKIGHGKGPMDLIWMLRIT